MTDRLPLLIALPPSEGKAGGGDGPPLDLAGLSGAPALTGSRARVLAALVRLCTVRGPRTETRARTVLGLSGGLSGELAVNAALHTSPTLPAAERYTGVLYDHLALGSLSAAARRRAEQHVMILSGLWGALRPGDAIPAYRLAIGVALPAVGPLRPFWRGPLGRVLPGAALVVDCRSAAYAAAWRPPAACTVLTVRVLCAAPDGSRRIVSHAAKATRGDVARALLTRAGGGRHDAGTPAQVAAVVRAAGLTCELRAPVRAGAAWTLDVLAGPTPRPGVSGPGR